MCLTKQLLWERAQRNRIHALRSLKKYNCHLPFFIKTQEYTPMVDYMYLQ